MEHFAPTLAAAASDLGVQLDAQQLDRLLKHLQLLERWNGTHNLVGPGSPEIWLERHTLDSLAAAPHLPTGQGFDVGSGAGFPGIPLAVARPDCRFTLVEPREKRAAFLANAIAALGLENAEVVREHLEPSPASGQTGQAGQALFAVSRATLPLPAWLELASGLLAPGGIAVGFLGIESWDQSRLEAAAKGSALIDAKLEGYQIGSQPTRTLALFRRQ